MVCRGGGLNKYQRPGADALQRPLVPRSRLQALPRLSHTLAMAQPGALLSRRAWNTSPSWPVAQDEEFQRALTYVLTKNAELYRRLA